MNKVDLRKFKGLEENPFHVQLLEEFSVKKKMEYISGDRGAQHLIIDKDGEVKGESRFFKQKVYDEEKFVKIFTTNMTNMWDMIPAATRVYSYILANMPVGSTEMYFYIKDIREYCRYKAENSVWRGINWLIENDFIAKSIKPGFYWLNPTLFFNGDRAFFVQAIIKEKGSNTKAIDDEENGLLTEG